MPSSTETSRIDELLRLKSEYLMPCVYHFYRRPPHIVAGEGCWLFDDAGRRYLDCYAGVTVMSAGHANREIIEAAVEQMYRLQHTTSIYVTEPVLRLAEALAEICPGDLKRSFFCASGSEAIEGAMLLAGLHTQRPAFIAMENALHGRTRWAMNATGLPMWRTDPFPLPDLHHVPFGDIDDLRNCLVRHEGRIAAVIGEPVQGNGGINVPSAEYWPAVRELCDRYGVLLILDEIQTGMSRTGRWFAADHWGITPDIMTVSKALGNGFPVSAFVATDTVAACYTRPGASTYGGNPVSAAAALATIRYHREHRLAQRASILGEHLLERIRALCDDHHGLQRPRGLGLMVGVELVDAADQPDAARLDRVLEALKDRGFLCGKTGVGRNVLTLMPPLIVEAEQLDSLIDALDAGLRQAV